MFCDSAVTGFCITSAWFCWPCSSSFCLTTSSKAISSLMNAWHWKHERNEEKSSSMKSQQKFRGKMIYSILFPTGLCQRCSRCPKTVWHQRLMEGLVEEITWDEVELSSAPTWNQDKNAITIKSKSMSPLADVANIYEVFWISCSNTNIISIIW